MLNKKLYIVELQNITVKNVGLQYIKLQSILKSAINLTLNSFNLP